ncbi:unannotated protein [freshwater metagenome]|uniref:Unannotated protein n=1 Tax=freshwater metagenome TaxID=449393 RepID=A0A6J7MDG3_9ZZZZ|nr:hypothetical protein [Actinomycetota bacterium]
MNAPEEIWNLGKAREQARAAKDFARADQLRDEIESLGWEIIDVSGTFEIKKKRAYIDYESSRAIKPIECGEFAFAMIVSGFQEDALETIESVRKFTSAPMVILCLGDIGPIEKACDANTTVIHLLTECGWAEAANALMSNVKVRFLILMDPSTRFTGDAFSLIRRELLNGEFAAVGWRGGLINLDDEWRSVDDKGAGEVDVLFSYFLAFDREAALAAGAFNQRATYYRNADIEFSLRLRHSQGRLLQMDLPLEQGRHHGYHDTDEQTREVQSKKNYDRILERFRGKNAILSPRR